MGASCFVRTKRPIDSVCLLGKAIRMHKGFTNIYLSSTVATNKHEMLFMRYMPRSMSLVVPLKLRQLRT
jgi:hypothetical protein